MKQVKIDISRRNPDDLIPATLILTARGNPTPCVMLERFRKAVEQWLATPDGQRSYKASSEDFNYGDMLSDDLMQDAAFNAILKDNDIELASIDTHGEVLDLGESYDTVFSPREE